MVVRRRPADEDSDQPEGIKALRGFTVVHVWAIQQTTGDDLPQVLPQRISGEVFGEVSGELWVALAAQVEAAGFVLSRGDCSPANGRTDFAGRTVTISTQLSELHAAKTLAHELGHIRLSHGLELGECRDRLEVEAESVAWLVCHRVGISTGDYSFPYVARWAGGDTKLVLSTAERALKAARAILGDAGLSAAETAV